MNIPSKEKIIETCKQLLLERIATAENAMNAAQEASNSEDKSSAGDKYETSRAMGQLDRNMNAKQLLQAKTELVELLKIVPQPTASVKSGALIVCKTDIYFIAVGLGPVLADEQKVVVISPQSPLAKTMWGKVKGDTFAFNQHTLEITDLL